MSDKNPCEECIVPSHIDKYYDMYCRNCIYEKDCPDYEPNKPFYTSPFTTTACPDYEICPNCGKYKRMQGNDILHQLCECGTTVVIIHNI